MARHHEDQLLNPSKRSLGPAFWLFHAAIPGAHAASGFALTSGYFLFRGRNRRRSLACLATGLATGILFGFGQVVRGAHFTSHNLAAAAICWFVALGLYAFVFRGDLTCASRSGGGSMNA